MNGRTTLTMAILAITALGAATVGFAAWIWFVPPGRFSVPQIVSIEKGESTRTVADRLAKAGVIRSPELMLLYAQLTGTGRRIRPGDYAFRGGERIEQVMAHLVRGDFIVVTVAIPEGLTLHQVSERLGAAGIVCQPDFEDAARTGSLVKSLEFGPLGAEGYLFPATYRFRPRATVDEILAAMFSRFYQIMTPGTVRRIFELGLTPREMVTLASIIETEARAPGERKLIASVFYNRMRLNMPLQSDPTAKYSFEGETEPVAAAVRIPSTFNTYAFAGLPPGPIANPGLKSIEAALYPAHTDYLYFVARDDGTHVFSRSLREHETAIAMLKRTSGHTSVESTRTSMPISR